MEPWVDKREVVAAHLVDTLGVLINERRVDDGVSAGLVVDDAEQGVGFRDAISRAERQVLIGGVVGPRRGHSHVAASPEQGLDRVREANVDRARCVGIEVLDWGGLDLLDEDVTRGASHLLTFIVGHNGVVGPYVYVGHDLVGIGVQKIAGSNWGRRPYTVVVRVNSEQIAEVAECKVDTHFVVWQSRGGQSNTGITRVEEWERKVESCSGQDLTTVSVDVDLASGGASELSGRGESNGAWVGEGVDVSDHIVVAVALAGGDGKCRPEIEVVVIKASRYEIVKRNGALRDQIVHQIARPAENSVTTRRRDRCVGGSGGDGVHCQTKPGVQEVITCTRDRH